MQNKAIKLLPHKSGKSYKICVDGVWYYASAAALTRVFLAERQYVVFRALEDIKQYQQQQEEDEVEPDPSTTEWTIPEEVLFNDMEKESNW